MVISDDIIFVQVPKTGCSHVAKLLEEYAGGVEEGKHRRLPKKHLVDSRTIVGGVRNPHDWYVSLWAYACLQKGGVYQATVNPRTLQYVPRICGQWCFVKPWRLLSYLQASITRKPDEWKPLYADSNNPELFREWLRKINNPENRFVLSEGYGCSSLSSFAGLLTYRFLFLATFRIRELYRSKFKSINDLVKWYNSHSYFDAVIRTEYLVSDFITLMDQAGVGISEQERNEITNAGPTNQSKRSRDLSFYYDDDTFELVKHREAFLFNMFYS